MSDIKRRDFLKVIGTASAGAALTGCNSQSTEKIIPYLVPPENTIPGVSSWFATVCRECPAGCGMRVRVREGRAVKVEGNPEHPVNRGALCTRGQASLQGLYNPDRIRQPLRKNSAGEFEPITWDEAESILVEKVNELRSAGTIGKSAFVTPLLTGSLDKLVDEWCDAAGIGTRLRYEPFAYESLRAANRLAFGHDTVPDYQIDQAEFLLSFGADFLETWISPVNYARQFSEFRKPRDGKMGRFCYLGPRLSLTAANADEWLAIKPGGEKDLALGLVHVILAEGIQDSSVTGGEERRLQRLAADYDPQSVASRTGLTADQITALARAFSSATSGLALAHGGSNATAVAVNLLNYVTGNAGHTATFGPDDTANEASTFTDLLDLTEKMNNGGVDMLLLYDVNPIFTLPEAAGFAEALEKVPFVASFSSFLDETTARAHLILPSNTPLESWGDSKASDTSLGLQQPAMQPLHETRAFGDTLLSVGRQVETNSDGIPADTFYAYLQTTWQGLQEKFEPSKDFNVFWEEALRRGGFWPQPPSQETPPPGLSEEVFSSPLADTGLEGSTEAGFALVAYPSPHFYDGRGANKPWLQEIPDPMTKVVWDSWVEIHPETAERLGVERGDLVKLTSPYGSIELPAFLYEGIHREAVAVPIGQGHTEYGRYAKGRGANPINLLSPEPEEASGGLRWLSVKVAIEKTGRRHAIASVGGSDYQLHSKVAQFIPLAALTESQGDEEQHEEAHLDMYAPHEHEDYRWGMSIDLNKCTGCNACVAACYAENNIPFVGPEETARGRDLAWLRIERYYAEDENQPPVQFLPMMCQQCDNAPCEPVCPVYATYHNPEGLNVQVYNRCVGTRYCSNNCPYKVRSFNWFDYPWPEPLHRQLNPDVTVRSKGVMEKCTFCVQRIAEAKDHAKDEGRKVRDGEIAPACVQTCPAQAIVFGNLDDPESRVAQMAGDPRRYHVLGELNTKPAVTYLKRIFQPPLGEKN